MLKNSTFWWMHKPKANLPSQSRSRAESHCPLALCSYLALLCCQNWVVAIANFTVISVNRSCHETLSFPKESVCSWYKKKKSALQSYASAGVTSPFNKVRFSHLCQYLNTCLTSMLIIKMSCCGFKIILWQQQPTVLTGIHEKDSKGVRRAFKQNH